MRPLCSPLYHVYRTVDKSPTEVMADPLSISASIAGLITLAEGVFRRTCKYIKSVREAPKEIAALSSEIGALYGILNHLHLIACQLEGETFDSAIKVHYIHSCYQSFEKVKTMLDKYDTLSTDRRSVDAMKRRLTWPFTVTEAKSLIAEVERHKATLGLALTADGMTGLLTALSRENELQKGVDEIKNQLRQRQEADTRIAIDKQRQKVLDSLGPCYPDKNHRMSLKLRHPGTGVWLTESDDFKRWLDTPHSKLWLRGIPGAGKTVLASSVIQEAVVASDPSVAVAFFYCDYKDVATQEPLNILGSLARQLARQNEEAFEKLQRLYGKHFLDNKMTTEYEPEELRDLILDMKSTFDSTLLLVDALDECGDNTSFVVELLASLNTDRNMSDVKTLFLSRDEQNIRDWLNDYCQISIAATSSDLKLYVGAEIEIRTRRNLLRLKDSSLKEHIMERLVSGAEGM